MSGIESGRTSGAFVVIVGPDGTGKTTLARELIQAWAGPTGYFHFRPPVVSGMASTPVETAAPSEKMPLRRRGDLPMGWLRLLRTALQCTVSYWVRIRPAISSGGLVVGDRWMYGYVTQPVPLRYYGPEWLARLVVGALPKPTVTVNLAASSSVLLARKQELSQSQLEAEMERTASLGVPNMHTLSSEVPPSDLAEAVLSLPPFKDAPEGEASIRGDDEH